MNRRDFLITASAAGIGAALPWSQARSARGERLRLAMIGTGMRGQSQLGPLLSRDDVDLVAICDTQQVMIDRALAIIESAGRPKPQVHGSDGDVNAWKRVLDHKGLDGVLIVTPWEWHAPMAIAARAVNGIARTRGLVSCRNIPSAMPPNAACERPSPR